MKNSSVVYSPDLPPATPETASVSYQEKFSRRVQNGKVVYVPNAPELNAKKPARRSSRPSPRRPLSLNFGPWLATILILGVGTAVAVTIWLSWLALSNPDAAFWLSRFLPFAEDSSTSQTDQPRTLDQIQRSLKTDNQLPGSPIVLTGDFSLSSPLKAANDLLIPISTQSCQRGPCPKLTELHIYRSLQLPYPLRLLQGERHYHLLDRMTVEGPTESDLIKLVRHSDLVSRSHSLPLTHLQQYQPAPKPGVWLRLSGLQSAGSSTSAYGQVFYFHPDQGFLGLMLNWASPRGNFPVWQQVLAGGDPELLIDQSVGLEPQFAVYQIQAAPNGIRQLSPIRLNQPAFKHPVYTQGLMLARGGLWRPALNLLKTVKKKKPQQWSAKAQAQFTLVELHAKVTVARAKQHASSPIQKIVALIINGSWAEALAVFEDKKTRPENVRAMLGADAGRLMERVKAALSVQPGQQDVIAWGAMVLHAQKGPEAAITWTRQQAEGKPAALNKVQRLLDHLETETPSPFDAAKKKKKRSKKQKLKESPPITTSPPAIPKPKNTSPPDIESNVESQDLLPQSKDNDSQEPPNSGAIDIF